MGGKKKSLASRLAKMSDEERARYAQMKTDQEEEVRRRKEQLVTAFMKNKIKKEDMFSRLNKAKINQQWHQFLRLRKCKEMKENCEHMKKWIERVIDLKNRTIDNLMKELDEAEFQYSVNLQAHVQHIDGFIEFHQKYSEQIKNDYESDLDWLLRETFDERMSCKRKTEEEIEHMKTLVYGQEVVGRASIRENHDYYLKLNEEYVKECDENFKFLRKKHEQSIGDIWRDIAAVLANYVARTDKRRAQLADMRRMDAESVAEINQNQARIELEEIQIERLKQEYGTLTTTRENTIKTLQSTIKLVSVESLNSKKALQNELSLDEKKLRFLTDVSTKCIADLETVVNKGEHILQLVQSCRRYETEKEKILRFSDLLADRAVLNGSPSESDTVKSEIRKEKIVEEVFLKLKTESEDTKAEEESEVSEDLKTTSSDVQKIEDTKKYKILIKHKYKDLVAKTKPYHFGEKLKRELDLVSPVSVCPKRRMAKMKSKISKEKIGGGTSSSLHGSGIVEETVESLMKLDGIWLLYNKVKLDCMEMKEEKSYLLEENRLLKETIKRVLESAVLKNDNDVEPLKRNRYVSAPPKYFI